MRRSICISGFLMAAMACSAESLDNTTQANLKTSSEYTGSWKGGQSDGSTQTGLLTFTVIGGVMAGNVAPLSGSSSNFSGTVTSSGSLTATASADVRGCNVAFAGQIATAASGASTATGTYTLLSSSTCVTNTGTWTATRPAAN